VIAYRDFVPRLLSPPGFLGEPEFETLQDAVQACGAWIDENGVDVVNVETVVLPNVHHPFEEGTEDVNLRQNDDLVTPWNQFVRVWYRVESVG
jgi:hypothetical protein